jgi:alkanesulfonate monooxygenase SsuD/methylene tetrahydromethanopterin reductase-like flavin-dependent oxidoreductase (luciferase family)
VSCGLRDVLSFEAEDKPAVLVASSAFAQAADHQAAALGQPEVRRVLVPHPIQDRTDDELRALARAAVDDVLAALYD